MMKTACNQILHNLEKNLAPSVYELWVKPLSCEVEGKKLSLTAPNAFVANWVRDKLMKDVRIAAVDVLGDEADVEVLVRKKADKPKAETKPKQLGLPIVHVPETKKTQAHNWRFSFDEFVTGPSNQLACAASQTLCDTSFDAENLFLHSGPGLGKTHLLQSIGRRLCEVSNKKSVNIACLSGEEFANRLVLALRAKRMDEFKARFREKADVLLLEDVHFFQNKEKMQNELLGTVKALRERGCKVVLTSSFRPREMSNIDDQLLSRFTSGFVASIDKPDFETRRRIVEHKARKMSVQVPDDVSELLAERIVSDIRQLESALNNLVFKARLLNTGVSTDMAWEVLENYAIENPSPDYDSIINFVCRYYGLSDLQLKSRSRKRQIVTARNTAFYLARKHTEMSLKDIGERLGRRHSTVLKGITNVEREISVQTPLGRQIEKAVTTLTN
ncbi:chromosomal replication initiator protein DnaA [Desulfovibrio oxyclinae]|uniref:chromosomal replication initiator protein DnaA n=1 Tax=Desulfovibrio oxyclinae TaxID=63560 RepID=UPI0003650D42|nr:chromosomal replication initiator protein DnaA [Desulfovibrio oxyclinae]